MTLSAAVGSCRLSIATGSLLSVSFKFFRSHTLMQTATPRAIHPPQGTFMAEETHYSLTCNGGRKPCFYNYDIPSISILPARLYQPWQRSDSFEFYCTESTEFSRNVVLLLLGRKPRDSTFINAPAVSIVVPWPWDQIMLRVDGSFEDRDGLLNIFHAGANRCVRQTWKTSWSICTWWHTPTPAITEKVARWVQFLARNGYNG